MKAAAAALAVGLMLVVSNGVEVDGELSADGSLRLRYTYDPPRHATFKSERLRLTSAHVRVETLDRDRSIEGFPPGEFVTATLAIDDATQISTAPAFAGVQVALDRAEGEIRITFLGLNPKTYEGIRSSPQLLDRRALRLSLLLPGPVKSAEPSATIDARRVTWNLSTRQYGDAGERVTLTASWTVGTTP